MMSSAKQFSLFVGVLAFALAARAWASPVVVTVITADTGQPVPGATVAKLIGTPTAANNVLRTTSTVIGSTDAHGQFHLDCDPAERSAFLVTATDKMPRTFGFWGCVPAGYRLALSNANGTLSGRIVDAASKPLVNSNVRVSISDYDLLAPVRVFALPAIAVTLSAQTDNTGRFTVAAPAFGEGPNVQVESADGWHSVIAVSGAPIFPDEADRTLRDGSFVGRAAPSPIVETRAAAPPARAATLSLYLRVLDADTNLPIPGVHVSPGGAVSPDQYFRTISKSAVDLPGDNVNWVFYDGAWAYFLRVEAEGYAPAPTRRVKASEKSAELELKLHKATAATISVRTPDGKPAAGAKAYLATPTIVLNVPLGPPRPEDAQPIAIAGDDGIIRFSAPGEPYRLAIFNSDGSAEATLDANKPNVVTLTPWASVNVIVAAAGKPLADAFLESQSGYSEDLDCHINWGGFYLTDAAGRLAMPMCRPGQFLLDTIAQTGELAVGWSYLSSQCELKPGQHLNWSLMAGKTTVRASLNEFPGYTWSTLWIQAAGPAVTLPPGVNQLPEKQRRMAVSEAQKTALDATAAETDVNEITLKPSDDGLISVAGLRPGTYILGGYASRIATNDPKSPTSQPANPPSLTWYFSVPTSQPATLDLGKVSPSASDAPVLAIGQTLPELTTTTLDGKPFSLRAYRGRWVLLDFWGTWCGFCIGEEPTLKDAYEGWSLDGRLAMVSASVDDTPDQVRSHVAEKQLAWTQIVLGPREKTNIPQKFGVDGYPTIMLISPDGKLVQTDLRGMRLRDALVEHLGPPAPPKK